MKIYSVYSFRGEIAGKVLEMKSNPELYFNHFIFVLFNRLII